MTLQLGAYSADVRTLQGALKAQGFYAGAIDGAFGPKTMAAVKAYQQAHGLVVDGVVGPKTWTALLAPVARSPYPIPRCWPLRCLLDGRKPQITSRYKTREPRRPTHNGVDILYRYKPDDPPMPIGDGGRDEHWWVPDNTWAIAPFTGRVVFAGDSKTGKRLWLEHPSGWCAGFFHLDNLAGNREGDALELGEDIGRVGHNPSGGSDPRHLHFELYYGDLVADVRGGRYPRGSTDPQLMLELTPFLLAA